jgi:hypothetical protein
VDNKENEINRWTAITELLGRKQAMAGSPEQTYQIKTRRAAIAEERARLTVEDRELAVQQAKIALASRSLTADILRLRITRDDLKCPPKGGTQ